MRAFTILMASLLLCSCSAPAPTDSEETPVPRAAKPATPEPEPKKMEEPKAPGPIGAAVEPKKDARPNSNKKDSYTDKVSVRQKSGQTFINPIETVAFRTRIDGKKGEKDVIYLYASGSGAV